MRKLVIIACGVAVFGGCRNPEGRLRPPDPIGYALFEMLDRGPRVDRNSDAEYLEDGPPPATPQRGVPPSANSIWVEGTWGVSNGRRVWIPAHWQ